MMMMMMMTLLGYKGDCDVADDIKYMMLICDIVAGSKHMMMILTK